MLTVEEHKAKLTRIVGYVEGIKGNLDEASKASTAFQAALKNSHEELDGHVMMELGTLQQEVAASIAKLAAPAIEATPEVEALTAAPTEEDTPAIEEV